METTGNGMTFTDRDIIMAKRVIGLMTKGRKFELELKEISMATDALRWFESELLPGMEQCVLEIKKVYNPPQNNETESSESSMPEQG